MVKDNFGIHRTPHKMCLLSEQESLHEIILTTVQNEHLYERLSCNSSFRNGLVISIDLRAITLLLLQLNNISQELNRSKTVTKFNIISVTLNCYIVK